MQLFKSERFQTEYREFVEKTSKVKDPQTKSELQQLLNKLVAEVKLIDTKHLELTTQVNLPSSLGDSKNNLLDIRKQINSKLKDCESAGLL